MRFIARHTLSSIFGFKPPPELATVLPTSVPEPKPEVKAADGWFGPRWYIDVPGEGRFKINASSKSDARASVKKTLGLGKQDRLPPGTTITRI